MNDFLWAIIKLSAVGFLVFLNGFFVAAEFALVKVRSTRIQELAREGKFGASMASHLVKHLDAYLSACQVGITIASLALGWIGEPAVAHLIEPRLHRLGILSVPLAHSISLGVGFVTIVFLHIVIGEMAPKSYAIRRAEVVALWIALPMRVFHWIMYPVIWVLNESALWMLRCVGLKVIQEYDSVHSAEELKVLLKQSSKSDQVTPVAGSLLLNVLDLRRRRARQVMLHRTKITCLSTQNTLQENLKTAMKTGHSRFPLCEGSIDEVVGMVHIRDFMWLMQGNDPSKDIRSIKREVLFVPELMPLEKLLNLFLSRRIHTAILIDEYGTLVGMVTLENILEEIVGDIQDEFDEEAALFQKVSDDEIRFHGEIGLHELEEHLGIHLTADDVTTLGGYLVKEFGRVPQKGESLIRNPWEFTVLRTTGRQVLQVEAKRLELASMDVENVSVENPL
jgi:CBS domain containing-hemolysin-like protein